MEKSPHLVVKRGRASHFFSPRPQPCPTAAPLSPVPGSPVPSQVEGTLPVPSSLRYAPGAPLVPLSLQVLSLSQVLPAPVLFILPVSPSAAPRYPVLSAPLCRCPSVRPPDAPLNILLRAPDLPRCLSGAPPRIPSMLPRLLTAAPPRSPCCYPRIPAGPRLPWVPSRDRLSR